MIIKISTWRPYASTRYAKQMEAVKVQRWVKTTFFDLQNLTNSPSSPNVHLCKIWQKSLITFFGYYAQKIWVTVTLTIVLQRSTSFLSELIVCGFDMRFFSCSQVRKWYGEKWETFSCLFSRRNCPAEGEYSLISRKFDYLFSFNSITRCTVVVLTIQTYTSQPELPR